MPIRRGEMRDDSSEDWREAMHFLWWYAIGGALATVALAVVFLIVLWIW